MKKGRRKHFCQGTIRRMINMRRGTLEESNRTKK